MVRRDYRVQGGDPVAGRGGRGQSDDRRDPQLRFGFRVVVELDAAARGAKITDPDATRVGVPSRVMVGVPASTRNTSSWSTVWLPGGSG